MKAILGLILISLPLSFASASHSGTYNCENDVVVGTITLDDSAQSHFMSVEIKRKDNGIVNEYSGAATRSYLGEQDLTTFAVGNSRLWFNGDGTIEYNKSIACTKK